MPSMHKGPATAEPMAPAELARRVWNGGVDYLMHRPASEGLDEQGYLLVPSGAELVEVWHTWFYEIAMPPGFTPTVEQRAIIAATLEALSASCGDMGPGNWPEDIDVTEAARLVEA